MKIILSIVCSLIFSGWLGFSISGEIKKNRRSKQFSISLKEMIFVCILIFICNLGAFCLFGPVVFWICFAIVFLNYLAKTVLDQFCRNKPIKSFLNYNF